jgi:hypothetical protein
MAEILRRLIRRLPTYLPIPIGGGRLLLCVLFSLAFALVATGCGGSQTSSTGTDTPTRQVQFTINWAERSRDINAPASALSATFRVKKAKANDASSDVLKLVDREDGTAAYSKTYTTDDAAYVGTRDVEVTFFAAKGGLGAVVATAGARLEIGDDGSLKSNITNVQKKIASVEVPAQTLNAGEQQYLSYSARDANGQVVAVAPGSAFFQVMSGKDTIMTAAGEVGTGIAGGQATVTATVDGVTSSPAAFTVRPSVNVAVIGNPNDPQVISTHQSLDGRKVSHTMFSSLPDPATLQSFDVLMVLGSTDNFAGGVSTGDAGKVKAFLDSGRGVVLLSNAPALLAGGEDLTSISSWFGGVSRIGFGWDAPASARTSSGDFALPPSIGSGAEVHHGNAWQVSNIQNATVDKVLISGSQRENASAIAYELPGGSRVYWQFHPYSLESEYSSKVLDLLIAGTNWTAKR